VTVPLPTSRTSPTAGLLNALARLYIRRAAPIIAAQQRAVDEARNLNHRLRTAASFADTDRAGYIDRTFLEKP
jgi:multidrug efflux pump subunit AcrA (membrane-fusion protein)